MNIGRASGFAVAGIIAALLLIVVVANPRTGGFVLGTIAGAIFDPVVAAGMLLAGALAGFGTRWWFGVIVSVGTSILHVAMGFSWWTKVAGRAAAIETAVEVSALDISLILYTFLICWLIRNTKFIRPS